MIRFHLKARRYLKPLDGEGDDTGGGAEDRGDNWTPTEEPAKAGADVEDVTPKPTPKPKPAPTPAPKKTEATTEEAEGEEEDGEEKPEKPTGKDTRMPLSRHKAILDAERKRADEMASKLARYEAGEKVAVTNDQIKALDEKLLTVEEAYNDLMAEGKTAEAKVKWRELRTLERQGNDLRVQVASEAARSQAIESVRYSTTVERLEAAYPAINPDHEDFDEELSQDVVRMSRSYNAEGMTPAEAIQKAVKRLCGTPKTAEQKTATETKARVDEKAVETEAAKLERERKSEAARKAAAAMGKQPPSTDKVGSDSDKAGGVITARDAIKLPFNEFKNLDERELARMRGDEL